ncbi:MAG: hypothetical protein RLZZ440_1694 [Planctomycetota bacterium]
MSGAAGAAWSRGLLVSVMTAAEARAAVAGGAAIIDVKDPSAGPLGRAAVSTTVDIVHAVAGGRPITLACGELVDGSGAIGDHVCQVTAAVPAGAAGPVAVKAGPRGLRGRLWTEAFGRLAAAIPIGVEPVAVAYADWRKAAADPPLRLLPLAREAGGKTVLIDTCDKSGPGLLALASVAGLQRWVAEAQALGLRLAVAGRLTAAEVAIVLQIGTDVAGVRSAACVGGRAGTVDASRVADLVGRAGHARKTSP